MKDETIHFIMSATITCSAIVVCLFFLYVVIRFGLYKISNKINNQNGKTN